MFDYTKLGCYSLGLNERIPRASELRKPQCLENNYFASGLCNYFSPCMRSVNQHVCKMNTSIIRYNTESCEKVTLVTVNDKPLVSSTHCELFSINFFVNLSSS